MRVVPKYPVLFLVATTLLFMVAQPVQAEIFVTTDSGYSVQVFSNTASGSDSPLRTITGISSPRGIFVDSNNGEIFVTRQGDQILVYDINADGAATPLRTITQDSSADYKLGDFQGVHVDVENNEIFVANRDGSVTVFNRTASGTLAPKRSLYGVNTGLHGSRGVFVQGDELFVANNTYPRAVRVFSRTASGNTAPLRVITNTATPPIGEVSQILVANGEVTVGDFGSNAIRTWPSTTNGDVVPSRMIRGATTELSSPRGVALCTGSNSLVVANKNADTLTFYSASANGDVAPTKSLATLAGPRFVSCTADSKGGDATPVPTLNNWGIILASLLLALGTIITLRRKHS